MEDRKSQVFSKECACLNVEKASEAKGIFMSAVEGEKSFGLIVFGSLDLICKSFKLLMMEVRF